MRRWSWGSVRLRRLDQIEHRLGQGAQEDVEDARFKSCHVSNPDNVNSDDGENDGDEDTQDGEEVNPGGGSSLGRDFLTDGVESRAANVFCPQDFQPAF